MERPIENSDYQPSLAGRTYKKFNIYSISSEYMRVSSELHGRLLREPEDRELGGEACPHAVGQAHCLSHLDWG